MIALAVVVAALACACVGLAVRVARLQVQAGVPYSPVRGSECWGAQRHPVRRERVGRQ